MRLIARHVGRPTASGCCSQECLMRLWIYVIPSTGWEAASVAQQQRLGRCVVTRWKTDRIRADNKGRIHLFELASRSDRTLDVRPCRNPSFEKPATATTSTLEIASGSVREGDRRRWCCRCAPRRAGGVDGRRDATGARRADRRCLARFPQPPHPGIVLVKPDGSGLRQLTRDFRESCPLGLLMARSLCSCVPVGFT